MEGGRGEKRGAGTPWRAERAEKKRKREDGIAAVTNERTDGRATLARAASARVDEMVRGEQSIRHHAFLLSARAQCVLYIPRAAVLLLLDRAENAPFVPPPPPPHQQQTVSLSTRYSDTQPTRRSSRVSIALDRHDAISRVNSRIEAPTSPLARNRHVSIDISRKMLLLFREFSLREYRVSHSRIEPSKFSPSLVKNRDIWIHVFGERYRSSFRNFLRKVSEYTPPDLS